MSAADKKEDRLGVETVTTIDVEEEQENATNGISPSNNNNTRDENASFCRGDHVYQWCSFAGIPRVFQHHGIIMHVEVLENGEEQLTIADFSNFLPDSKKEEKKRKLSEQSSASLVGGGTCTGGILRVYTTTTTSSSKSWHKVEYNAPRWKTVLKRSGVSTTVAASDSPEVVLNRVNFLIMQSERNDNNTFRSNVLPKYHLLFANCECVAMWCKTGRWSTLQGASFLTGAAYGSTTVAIGQAAGGAAAVVGTAVEVAAVSEGVILSGGPTAIATAQPWMLTALAASGAVAVGGVTGTLWMARSKWNATTKRLNAALDMEISNSIAIPT